MSGKLKGLLVLAAVLLLLPLLLSNNYQYDVVIRIAMNAIVVIGLNLLIGYTGQISLGHAGFLGIGAYASGILTTQFSWPPLLALLAGCVAANGVSDGRRVDLLGCRLLEAPQEAAKLLKVNFLLRKTQTYSSTGIPFLRFLP